jgi:hypothetical protein
MNFKQVYLQGKEGKSIGLSTGIKALDQAIYGIQKKHTYSVAASPKVGKTTFSDYVFVLAPYLQALARGTLENLQWIYYSYEIDRISKEFKFAAFFMFHDYGIHEFTYKDKKYPISQDYLMGKMLHLNSDGTLEQIKVEDKHEEILKTIYHERIIPLFGEYDETGKQIKTGKIVFIEDPENPTGLYKSLLRYASTKGNFIKENYQGVDETGKTVMKERVRGYTPNNPDLYTIIIVDHIRKFGDERGFTMKQKIDKWLEYSTWIRNMCGFTFVNIIHMNRGLANIERIKYAGEFIYPTGDDIKDSGNISEETTVLLTLFNPQDEKYGLKKHFGMDISNLPNYRSIHVADSRYTECPLHIQTNMYGGINYFEQIKK